MHRSAHAFPDTLRRFRKARRISQLELALQLGVSQRHVSFVESGRARPSRPLLLAWLQALDTPLALSNAALQDAGYAPAYTQARLDGPWLQQAHRALEQLLRAHEPAPALVLDADWNVLRMNRGAVWLARTLMPSFASAPAHAPMNMLDLLTEPTALARCVTNLHDVGPPFLAMLRREAMAHPPLLPRVQAYEAYLHSRIGSVAAPAGPPSPASPVLTTRLASPHGNLAFFSMFSTFGTPQDITLASLRVESMFAADEATQALLRQHVN